MAEGFALLLGEIDLSIGYVAAVGGIIAAELVQPGVGWPWWSAVVAALLVCGLIGALQGTLITRLRLPSFVVTLAGFLIWFGFMIVILGPAGGVSIASPQQPDQRVLYNLVQGTIDPVIAWIGLTVIVAVFGVVVWLRDASRRRAGLVAPPATLTALKIVFLAVIGIVVVAICDIDRGVVLPITGVPWVVPLVLGVLVVWTVLLERTKFGRYVYAVGGNPEATRRAGISLAAIRTWAFALCSLTAGMAGLLYASWQGGMNTNVNGGQLVLYAVAAAVIGGTSLFGGRGRMVHGVLGGLVIGTIYNGLYLLGFPVQWQLIATGLVLLAAVIVDSFSRRGAGIGTGERA
jgi:D-xylose transport system permease protein